LRGFRGSERPSISKAIKILESSPINWAATGLAVVLASRPERYRWTKALEFDKLQ
jgi:hypothetical protein